MKKILAAGIVRTLQFDHENEADAYLKQLKYKKIRYQINWQEQLSNGVTIMSITTAYNNSTLIERISLIGETGDQDG